MFSFILRGGFLIWPILLCSVISTALIIERCIFYYKNKPAGHNLFSRIKKLLEEDKANEALKLAENSKGAVAHILSIGIYIRKRTIEEKEKIISRAGSKIISQFDKHLRPLVIIGNIAPLLGLLGTVTGMIKVFMKIQELGGKADTAVLAGGIWEALITTALGLSVAIPTLVAYHYFEGKADQTAMELKDAVAEFLELKI